VYRGISLSVQEDLAREGIKLSTAQKRQLKQKVQQLKSQKKLTEAIIRDYTARHRHNGKWDSKASLATVINMQSKRSKINYRIFRLGGSKTKNPEFDSE